MDILRSAVFIGLACVVSWPQVSRAQLSPGDLAEAHKEFEGMSNCMKCHELGAGPSAKKCLECHKEIALGIDDERGYHYLVVSRQKRACFECHSDHAGRSFELVHWPNGRNNFNHAVTGYDLAGGHKSAKCRDCHTPERVSADIAAFEQVDVQRTFLGLNDECLTCHVDEHRAQLGTDCVACHGDVHWKPAPQFDHNKVGFRLTGLHLKVDCAKCHPMVEDEQGELFAQYTNLPFQDCVACHQDPHLGRFEESCSSCHATTGWRNVAMADFNHSTTQFPLVGMHASATCDRCHQAGESFKGLQFDRCDRCHADEHRGQFDKLCEACHDEQGFTPAYFTAEDHRDTRFHIAGAHLATPCISCHLTISDAAGEYRQFRYEDTRCEVCHDDVHYGQFSSGKTKKSCDVCHSPSEWAQVDFDHDRGSRYKLEGEHKRVPCDGCHVTVSDGGHQFVRYKPIDASCVTCHANQDELKEL